VHCCNSGSFLNNDERNAVEKIYDSSSDLQAVTLTKVSGMHFGIIFQIPIELTLIITYLLMLTQQYLTFPLTMYISFGSEISDCPSPSYQLLVLVYSS
jgi:hypothetical protein